uniref:Homeobox domain-containing protein n=1 Tax=Angiostrongylus cantonensis TaxID=6313 RepID=A0A158PCT0_ANGCA
MDVKYKYAIVRVKESSVIDFFGLIVADSEDHCSVSATPVSPADEFTNGSTAKRLSNNNAFSLMSIAKVEREDPNIEDEGEDGVELSLGTFPQGSAPIDLVSGLFATHKVPVLGSDWASPNDLKARQFVSNHSRIPPYKQLEGFQTRMKGWQREYIKDIIKEGHYPTEDELRDIEIKCDLSRKQVLRFIAKRVGNPNRKPRDGRLPPATPEEIQQTLEKFSSTSS